MYHIVFLVALTINKIFKMGVLVYDNGISQIFSK